MASWKDSKENGKRIGCLYEKHIGTAERLEVCMKPSA